MKKQLLNVLTAVIMLLIPSLNFAQAAPPLGTTASFALFTTVGAVTNIGTYKYLTHVTGNVGTNSGSSTNFGNVNGVMHDNDGASGICAADLLIAANSIDTSTANFSHAPALGGETLIAGVYAIAGVATLNTTLTLNAKGNSNAVFIFKISAALNTSANSKIKLINGALACNVFWKVEGAVSMGAGTAMKGTVIANNSAINFSAGDTLEGRALSIAGAINIADGGVLIYTPIGCQSPNLTGPAALKFVALKRFVIFTSIGPVKDDGTSHITGDVGTNGSSDLTTGFDPLKVYGAIHPIPDDSTVAAAADLLNVVDTLINKRPYDIELLDPSEFGHNLVLTPHTYIMNGITYLTDTLYLDALGNVNAVFIIKINNHAFNTNPGSKVKLINGTQAKNVFWFVNNSAVSVTANSVFYGTIIANNGAIEILPGAIFNGRAFTTDGAISTTAMTATLPSPPSIIKEPVKKLACTGDSVSIAVTAKGSGLTYQWRKGNDNLSDVGNISGTTSAKLTINPVKTTDAGTNYNVVISGTYLPNDTSINDTLVVSQTTTPTVGLITQPTCTVATGSVILGSLPAGNWVVNPGAVMGSGASTTISGLSVGTYNYTVTNSSGCTSSAHLAQQFIVKNSGYTFSPGSLIVNVGDTVKFQLGSIHGVNQVSKSVYAANGNTLLAGGYQMAVGALNGMHVFTSPDTFYYVCPPHAAGGMKGIIIVKKATIGSSDVVINKQPATPAAPAASVTLQPTCTVATGTITVSSTTTALSFSIDGSTFSNTTGIFTMVAVGNYSVTAKNSVGCVSSGTSVTLISCITDIASIDGEKAVTIYPNPFTTSIDIVLNDALKINRAELRIYNVLGKEVLNAAILQHLTTLKTSNLPSGIYFYKLMGNDNIIQSGKLIAK
jgi:plastocyanin